MGTIPRTRSGSAEASNGYSCRGGFTQHLPTGGGDFPWISVRKRWSAFSAEIDGQSADHKEPHGCRRSAAVGFCARLRLLTACHDHLAHRLQSRTVPVGLGSGLIEPTEKLRIDCLEFAYRFQGFARKLASTKAAGRIKSRPI